MSDLPVLTRAAALAGGRSATEIDSLVRSGRWRVLRRCVYATSQAPADHADQHAMAVIAAVLATDAEAVGSHESAATIHGLPLLRPYGGPPLLTLLRSQGARRPSRREPARLVSQVRSVDRTVQRAAPVTSLPRTAVDLARTRSPLAGVVALDAALRAGVPREVLHEVAAAQRGWPGISAVRELIDFARAGAESALESVGRLQMHDQGLPPPELQVLLGGPTGPIGRVDFYFRGHRTVGEADGYGKYNGSLQALRDEKRREDLLRDHGFEVFRFTWAEALYHPELLRERALRAFARADRRALIAR